MTCLQGLMGGILKLIYTTSTGQHRLMAYWSFCRGK